MTRMSMSSMGMSMSMTMMMPHHGRKMQTTASISNRMMMMNNNNNTSTKKRATTTVPLVYCYMLTSLLSTTRAACVSSASPWTTSPSRFFSSSTLEEDSMQQICPDEPEWFAIPTDTFGTVNFRMYYVHNRAVGDEVGMSPWHDIPLFIQEQKQQQEGEEGEMYVHYINEIPKDTTEKMEIATTEAFNPIKQDTNKQDRLRYLYQPMPFNYGALPQTWEDPQHRTEGVDFPGDNDPLDVVEISPEALTMGAVVPARVLGAYALIDEGEADWKVITIQGHHPLASVIRTIDDVEEFLPGTLESIKKWFQTYKVADGKPENTFALEGKVLDKESTMKLINEMNRCWKKLIDRQTPNKYGFHLPGDDILD